MPDTPPRPRSMAPTTRSNGIAGSTTGWGEASLARALFAYLSSGENQLSFHEGDLIALMGKNAFSHIYVYVRVFFFFLLPPSPQYTFLQNHGYINAMKGMILGRTKENNKYSGISYIHTLLSSSLICQNYKERAYLPL